MSWMTYRVQMLLGVIVIFLGLGVGTDGGDDFWYDRIEESLGVDISEAVIVTSYDDHSGFHGDGTMYAVLEFQDDTTEQLISNPGGWQSLPLTENLQTLIYGTRSETASVGPYIGVTVPRVEQGYWYFYDRYGDTWEDADVLDWGSFNYTIAIYDSEEDRLYYCEYDT